MEVEGVLDSRVHLRLKRSLDRRIKGLRRGRRGGGKRLKNDSKEVNWWRLGLEVLVLYMTETNSVRGL